MISKNEINKYEYVGTTIPDSCKILNEVLNFSITPDSFKNSNYLENVTKEGFGLLFLEGKNNSVDITPCKDIINIKQLIMPKTNKPVVVLFKNVNSAYYQMYGVFEQTYHSNKRIELTQYNPTYYKDEITKKFIY